MPKEQRVTLQDVINYKPETYLTEEDMALARTTFKNNPRLFKLLKKVFLPSISDPDMPVEEISKDVWMNMREWDAIPTDEVKALVVARQDAIKFIAGGLIVLKMLANSDEENPMATALRRKQDSAK